MLAKDRIICALDVDNVDRALELVRTLRSEVGVFKIGLELLNAAGLDVLERLRNEGADRIFYDAKLHDIPNTVAGALRGIAKLGVWCVTLHASGGAKMLAAAVSAARDASSSAVKPAPKLLAVTLLTSIGAEELSDELRVSVPPEQYVPHLARLAYTAGCDGVIASPLEIAAVRSAIPDPNFLIITPGVRPAGSDPGDQARVMTPEKAIRAGADYLVIGRPIVAAPDPAAAAATIAASIAAGPSR